MSTLLLDLRQIMRRLRRAPGFALGVVFTLALGLGANTAVFSVVHAVLWSRLPYPDADELAVLWETDPEKGETTRGVQTREGSDVLPPRGADDRISPLNYFDWRDQARSFRDLGAFRYWGYTFTGGDEPADLTTVRVTSNLFQVLGVAALHGRTFAAEEGIAGNERVAVVSYGFWQRRFGADPELVGRIVQLDGEPYQVVGIMPPGFEFPLDPEVELWTPLTFKEHELRVRRERILNVVGRLERGASVQGAQSEMNAIARRLADAYPESNAGWGIRVVPAREQIAGKVRPALLLLLAAVGLVLLITCANLASVLLARAHARRGEVALRVALGAPAARILRQLLTEAVLLSLAGGAVGLLVALWSIDVLSSMEPVDVPRLHQVELNLPVFLFAAGASFVSGLAFGAIPALQALRLPPAETLNEGSGRSSPGRRGLQLQRILIASQVAVALVLLVGGGLLLRSFIELQKEDPGFNPDRLLGAQVYLPQSRYPEDHHQAAFFERLVTDLEALPGVVSAGAVSSLPLGPTGINFDLPFTIEGRPPPPAWAGPQADIRIATDGYFATMGIPLIRGRTFSTADTDRSRRVMVINQTMSRRFWGGEDPVGDFLTTPLAGPGERHEIIGVVGDVKHYGLGSETRPEMYVSHRQASFGGMVVVARTEGDPLALTPALKRVVWTIDPDQPVSHLRSMEQFLGSTLATRRLTTTLVAAFAALAVLLSAVGLYGLMAYFVAQRARELGIRMALGADRANLMRLVVTHAMTVTAVGIVVGLAVAAGAARLLSSLLFEVKSSDPATFVLVPAGITLVALLATYLPARRAAAADPLHALKHG